MLQADAPESAGRLLAETGPYGADAAIEAVGVESATAHRAGDHPQGRRADADRQRHAHVNFDLQSIVTREITVYGSCASNGEFTACVELVASGQIQVEPLDLRVRHHRRTARRSLTGSTRAPRGTSNRCSCSSDSQTLRAPNKMTCVLTGDWL